MCGIFAYVGEKTAIGPQVLGALKTLEYRGYDSWGVAVGNGTEVAVEKAIGKIGGASVALPESDIGFGHTRWATHGGVTHANAHPHLDCSHSIAVVHNGIVENYRDLRAGVSADGHPLVSETDSEVIPHLLEIEWSNPQQSRLEGFRLVFQRLDGLNAVIAMDLSARTLFAAKNVSPLVIGKGARGYTLASDALALEQYADMVCYLEDGQVAQVTGTTIDLIDSETGAPISPAWHPLQIETRDLSLGSFRDFMSKEMAEQPEVLHRLVADGQEQIRELAEAIQNSYGTFLIGCGTASYAALTGSYLFSRIASRHVNFVVGSEFKYYEHFLTPRSLVVAMSQSGETADIIEAMLSARGRESRLAALVNAEHSTLDRMVDLRVHLNAGPEQCVLSTKAYTAKVAVLLMVAHELAGTPEIGRDLVLQAAEGLSTMLQEDWVANVRLIASTIFAADHLFVIGRGLSYPTALEAALKIKEVSYIHAEGFAGGELKHGVIALVQGGTPCVVYAPMDETRNDILSGAMELKARGGHIIGISPQNDPVFDAFIETPDIGDAAPIVQALPAQMIGYHAAMLRGNDPDKPRNLAKSVTVK